MNLALVGEGGHRGGGSIVIGQSPDGNERIGFQFLARQAAINIQYDRDRDRDLDSELAGPKFRLGSGGAL